MIALECSAIILSSYICLLLKQSTFKNTFVSCVFVPITEKCGNKQFVPYFCLDLVVNVLIFFIYVYSYVCIFLPHCFLYCCIE